MTRSSLPPSREEDLALRESLLARSCCFTGHRPEKLTTPETVVRARLAEAIEAAVREGKTRFISGMARGVDLWAAQEVLKARNRHPGIQLVAAVPFDGVEERWSPRWRAAFREVIGEASEIHFFGTRFRYSTFETRNRYMVDHASLVIALCSHPTGGTARTLAYARKLGRAILLLPDGSEA